MDELAPAAAAVPGSPAPEGTPERSAEPRAASPRSGPEPLTGRAPGRETRVQQHLRRYAAMLGVEVSHVLVKNDEEARARTEARGARGLAARSVVLIHPDVPPESDEERAVIAHEVVHLAQMALFTGKADIGAAEAEARRVGAGLAAGGGPLKIKEALPPDHEAADKDDGGDEGAEKPKAPERTLPDKVPYQVQNGVFVVRKSWWTDPKEGEVVDLDAATFKAPRRHATMLRALRDAGVFYWLTDERIAEAAQHLTGYGPIADNPEIFDWPMHVDAYERLGVPDDAEVLWIRMGDGMTSVVKTDALARASKKDKKRSYRYRPNKDFKRRMFGALAATVGMELVPGFLEALDGYALEIDVDPGAEAKVVEFDRDSMERFFGAEAWQAYLDKGYGGGSGTLGGGGEGKDVTDTTGGGKPRPRTEVIAGLAFDEDIPAEDRKVVEQFADEIGLERRAPDPNKPPPPPASAYLVTVIKKIKGPPPHPLHDRIIQHLQSSGMAKGEERLTGFALQQVIERAELDQAYSDVGILPPHFLRDDDGKKPLYDTPVRGEIVNRSGGIMAEETAEFAFARSNPEYPLHTVPKISIQWVTHSLKEWPKRPEPKDTDGDGIPEVDLEALKSEPKPAESGDRYHGPVTKSGTELREGNYRLKLEVGVYAIHAFVHHNYYRPAHFWTPVQVKTEKERVQEGQDREFGPMGPRAEKEHWFDTGWFDDAPLLDDDSYDKGKIFEGRLPDEWKNRTYAERTEFIRKRKDQMLAVIKKYKDRDDDVYEYAKSSLEKLEKAEKTLDKEKKDGFTFFECRAMFVSRRAGVPDGGLTLVSNAKKHGGTDFIGINVHDYTKLYEPEDYNFSSIGTTFDGALEAVFLKLTKSYPPGRMSLLAETLEDDAKTRTKKTKGFELDTGSAWKTVKAKVWDPAVKMAVNLAGAILMVAFPATIPAVTIFLAAYNGIEAIDNYNELEAKGIATRKDLGFTIASIAMDLLPLLGRAKPLFGSARTTHVMIEISQWGGMAAILTVDGMEQLRDLRDNDLLQIAELNEWLSNPSNQSHPDFSARQQQLEALIKVTKGRGTQMLDDMVKNAAIMIVPNAVATSMTRRVMRGQLDDLIQTGVMRHDPQATKPYYDPYTGEIRANTEKLDELGLTDITALRQAYVTDMGTRSRELGEVLGVPADKVGLEPGDSLSVFPDGNGGWRITVPPGTKREDVLDQAWRARKALDPSGAPKERPALSDKLAPVYDPAAIASGKHVLVGNPIQSRGDAFDIFRKVSAGDPAGFDALGVRTPDGFDGVGVEWGLGVLDDGSYVIVKGEAGSVNWGALHGVAGIAHSHHFGEGRAILGGEITVKTLMKGSGDSKVNMSRGRVLPSASDFAYASRHGITRHVVLTPYVYKGGGVIGNPAPGKDYPRVEFEIVRPDYVGDFNGDPRTPVHQAKMTMRAGDKELWSGDVWVTWHDNLGDEVSTTKIPHVPANTGSSLPPRDTTEAPGDAWKRFKPSNDDEKAALADWKRMHDNPDEAYDGNLTFREFVDGYRDGLRFGYKHGDQSTKRRWYNPNEGEKDPHVFDVKATPKDVLEHLTGKESTSSFKPFVEMLYRKKLAKPEEIEKLIAILDPAGKPEDTIRRKLKEHLRPRIFEYFEGLDKKKLKKLHPDVFKTKLSEADKLEAAKHQEMMDIAGSLPSSDKGNLVEQLYIRFHAPEEAQAHVPVDAAAMKKKYGIVLEKDPRNIDILDGQTITELKTWTDALGAEEWKQFLDYVKLIGKEIPDKFGNPVTPKRIKYVFAHPDGAKHNIEWMRDAFAETNTISFEVYNKSGHKKLITNEDQLEGLEAWLKK